VPVVLILVTLKINFMDSYNQKLPKIRDEHSFVPFQISMYFKDEKLASGTAFLYSYEGKSYLVTNWHNVTAREPDTLASKNEMAAIPDRLLIKMPHSTYKSEYTQIEWKEHHIKLYEDSGDTPTKPLWYEHPTHGRKVDVVVIPMNDIISFEGEEISSRAANDLSLNPSQIIFRPGLDVFVLGFPLGMKGGGDFPIWKRGSIATEPDFDIDDLPKIYIDTATREGMSGSPVYAQETGYWFPEDATNHNEPLGGKLGRGIRFLGVYSGRIGDGPFKAQLGIVWKHSAIEEIIQAKVTGISSFYPCDIRSSETSKDQIP
jgi:Trypsin-like peptidase domain